MRQAPMTDISNSVPPRESWLYNARIRGIASQVLVLALMGWGLYEIVFNTQANLAKLNKTFGFDFLTQTAGFDLSTSLNNFTSSSTYGKALMAGFLNTILVSGLGIVFATIIGFVVGIMRLSKNWLVSRVATLYVEIVRNIPLLIHLLVWYALVLKPLPGPKQAISLFDMAFISNRGVILPQPQFGARASLALWFFAAAVVGTYFLRRWARERQARTGETFPGWLISIAAMVVAPLVGLLIVGWPVTFNVPALAGFNFKGGMTMVPEFAALLLGISIYTASFIAEIVRSGIQAVSHGQSEAAQALGLRNSVALRLVVVPQAFRVIIPPLASQYLNLTKNSSLAIAIGFPDLVYAGGTVNNQSGKIIEVVVVWMVVYLSLSLLTAAFMNWFNSRMKLVER
jgi:general L-amino acid transport system permease protein